MLAMEHRPTAKLQQRFRSYRMSTSLETAPETAPKTAIPTTTSTHSTTTTMASTSVAWPGAFSQLQERSYLPVTSSYIPVCSSNSFPSLTPALSSPLPEKQADTLAKPDLLPPTTTPFDLTKSQSCGQRPYEEPLEFYPSDPDAPIEQAYTTDEAVPIMGLKFSNRQDLNNTPHGDQDSNRLPVSAMTASTCGPGSDLPSSFEEFAANMSDQPGFTGYLGLTSNRTSVMSSSQISPASLPRTSTQAQSRHEQVRSHSRTGRMSSSPRPSSRVSPYSLDNHRGASSRWSTPTHSSGRSSPYAYTSASDLSPANQRLPLQPSSIPLSNYTSSNLHMHRPQVYTDDSLLSQTQPILGAPPIIPSMGSQPLLPEPPKLPQAPILASHGLLSSHYADFADPPDLFASLHEEPCKPPPEDMNPSDPDMVPYEEEVRYEGDLYSPMLVRGHGNKREGWCGMCKPGRWLVLRNSAYWYDKSFKHGISVATGQPFQEPLDERRMDGNPNLWEGLCCSCNEWIALLSSKKKPTTWFRHAYYCQS